MLFEQAQQAINFGRVKIFQLEFLSQKWSQVLTLDIPFVDSLRHNHRQIVPFWSHSFQ